MSNASWAYTVIHKAPLDKACEAPSNPVAGIARGFVEKAEPADWKQASFDDSAWKATTTSTGIQTPSLSGTLI